MPNDDVIDHHILKEKYKAEEDHVKGTVQRCLGTLHGVVVPTVFRHFELQEFSTSGQPAENRREMHMSFN